MLIKAKIRDSKREWVEELKAKSLETAKEDIQKILDSFNSSLRPNETTRFLVEILGEKEFNENTKDIFGVIHKWLGELRRENMNAYGAIWVKENINKINSAYNYLCEKGKITRLYHLIENGRK